MKNEIFSGVSKGDKNSIFMYLIHWKKDSVRFSLVLLLQEFLKGGIVQRDGQVFDAISAFTTSEMDCYGKYLLSKHQNYIHSE